MVVAAVILRPPIACVSGDRLVFEQSKRGRSRGARLPVGGGNGSICMHISSPTSIYGPRRPGGIKKPSKQYVKLVVTVRSPSPCESARSCMQQCIT